MSVCLWPVTSRILGCDNLLSTLHQTSWLLCCTSLKTSHDGCFLPFFTCQQLRGASPRFGYKKPSRRRFRGWQFLFGKREKKVAKQFGFLVVRKKEKEQKGGGFHLEFVSEKESKERIGSLWFRFK